MSGLIKKQTKTRYSKPKRAPLVGGKLSSIDLITIQAADRVIDDNNKTLRILHEFEKNKKQRELIEKRTTSIVRRIELIRLRATSSNVQLPEEITHELNRLWNEHVANMLNTKENCLKLIDDKTVFIPIKEKARKILATTNQLMSDPLFQQHLLK